MPIIIENWNGFRVEEHNGHIELYWRTSAAATINAETLWTSFAAAFPSYASHGSFHAVYGNAGNDVIERRTGGDVFAWGGNDTLNLYATNGTSQIHTWAGGGNDIVNMNFSNITAAYSHGHHNRGDDGNDAFNFVATNSVGANETIVGRLEDFDASRDSISINGALVNLSALPTNVKIVLHNGDHNDPGAEPQQWLVIKTSTGGYILYTLEGARVDMVGTNGGSNDGAQESHFLNSNGIAADEIIALYESLPSATYVDTQNYVPLGTVAEGGLIINDTDKVAADVNTAIAGGANGDLIAAGLNNDTVNAGSGNDQVWGGSGNDLVNGENDNDTLSGNLGDDTLVGGQGNDHLKGGNGQDYLDGGSGNDTLDGGNGGDTLVYGNGTDALNGGGGTDTLVFTGSTATTISLYHNTNNRGITFSGIENLKGGSGNDSMIGNAGNNSLSGNDGNDSLSGYGGNDHLIGGNGDDYLWGIQGNDTLEGNAGIDYLEGGDGTDLLTGGSGNDTFRFSGTGLGVDSITDFSVVSGNDDRFLLSASGFGGGLTTGTLAASKFRVNTTGSGQDSDDRFIYNSGNKGLYFDADGVGGAASVKLATLQSWASDLTNLDFYLN